MSEKADESENIKRAREKLEKQLTEERKLFNPEKLREATRQIYRWIERNSSERVSLKEKNIELFDQNAHSARTSSKFVKELRTALLTHAPKSEEAEAEEAAAAASLKGRVQRAGDRREEAAEPEPPKTDSESQ